MHIISPKYYFGTNRQNRDRDKRFSSAYLLNQDLAVLN